MSDVIETVKQLLSDSDLLDEFNGYHVDYVEDSTGSCGLYSNGSVKISEDVLGNAEYQHSFVLYAVMESYEDFNRLKNGSFLLELGYWLDSLKNISITAVFNGEEKNGVIRTIACSNAMPFAPVDGDFNNGIQYQIQINVRYKIME